MNIALISKEARVSDVAKKRNIHNPGATKALRKLAGPKAKANAWLNKSGDQRTIIQCWECINPTGERWTSFSDKESRGAGARFRFTLDVWEHHLYKWHGETCPWSRSPERQQAYRDYRGVNADLDAYLGIERKPVEVGPRIC